MGTDGKGEGRERYEEDDLMQISKPCEGGFFLNHSEFISKNDSNLP